MAARLLFFKGTMELGLEDGSGLSSNTANLTVLMFSSFSWINPLQVIFIILPVWLLLGRNRFAEALTSPFQKSHLCIGIGSTGRLGVN